jgi:hypothetical protein
MPSSIERGAQEADHRHRRLLRSRDHWPNCRAEKRDELAPFHHVEHQPLYAVGLPYAQAATELGRES